MSQMVTGPARTVASAHTLPRRHGLLRDLVLGRAGGNGAHAVDRARPARAVHHRREPARRRGPPGVSAAPRHGIRGVRHPLRRPGVGLRRVVGQPGGRADRTRGPPAAPVQPHLVVVYLPLGTCVTGTSGLALHTGAGAFRWAAVALYLALVAAGPW